MSKPIVLFPTLIHFEKLKGTPSSTQFLHKLISESYAFQSIDDAGKKWSEINYFAGYTSYGSLTDLPLRSPTFSQLQKSIDKQVAAYARKLGYDLKGGKLKMVSCWINIMGHGSHHSGHIHPLSVISGTFYVKVPKGSGCFKIEDPRMSQLMAAPSLEAKLDVKKDRFYKIEPKAGHLVLFESYIRHEVEVNRSQNDRISVSFNYDWV